MDILFLDANVLFSAAYQDNAALLRLWKLKNVRLVTSQYALEEARRNLSAEKQQDRLKRLIQAVKVMETLSLEKNIPETIHLAAKDRPILAAAIEAKATHLITGDFRDFGDYFNKTIEGVLILPPAVYLK